MPTSKDEYSISEPFIRSGDPRESEEAWMEDTTRHSKRGRTRSKYLPVIIHTGIAFIYFLLITAFVIFNTKRVTSHRDTILYSPSQAAIKYELKTLKTVYSGNPFAGDPRPEHDQAWSNLLENSHIRISEEDLKRLNKSSIALKDGSGYIAQIGAYHELHCVHWIRKWMHREHYWPALEGAILEERKIHIDHCLEMMRLAAMCHGSQAVSTFQWYGSLPRPKPIDQYECINWDAFNAWNAERRVDLYDLDALKERPEPQDWELIEHDVRLGVTKGRPEQDGGLQSL